MSNAANNIPNRDQLHAAVQSFDRITIPFIIAELLLGLYLVLYYFDLEFLGQEFALVILVITLAVGEALLGLAHLAVERRVRFEDIKPQVMFGHYNRDRLVQLANQAFQSLTGAQRNVPFFLTRDKDLNASAIAIGLKSLLPALNGVHINRAVLYHLTPQELLYLMGHELGHLVKHHSLWEKLYLFHLLIIALISVALLQYFGGLAGYAPVVILGVLWSLHRLVNWPRNHFSSRIEYLCDETGAQVAGYDAAIAALLKIGSAAEVQLSVLAEALRLKLSGVAVTTQQILDLYQQALPWGQVNEAESKKILRALVKDRAEHGQISLRGFINHLFASDSADQREALKAQLAEITSTTNLARIDLSPFISREGRVSNLQGLVEQLKRDTESVLFRLPEESSGGDSHPSFRKRLLYLYENRAKLGASSIR
jgi:Zn-dependent protease with chaperone function